MDDRAELLKLIRDQAIVWGKVTLSSGQGADYYVDLRRITLDAQAAPLPACPQPGPERIVEQRQLLARALARIEALPQGLREAMRLRVIEEQPTDAVCRELGISEENLFVRVHRARKHLLS